MTLIPAAAEPASAACTVRTDWLNRHTISRGETLYRIALRYGTNVATLANGNCLSDPSRIYAGQVLRVPGGNGSDTSGWTLLMGNPVPLYVSPSRQSALVATLTNENVLLLGRTADTNYLKVQTNTGLSGWMWSYDVPAHSDFIIRLPIITKNPGGGVQAYVAETYVRMRSGPGYEYNVIGYVHRQMIGVIGKSYNGQWVKVNANGKTGWVYRQLVSLSGADFANLPEVW
jgi:LysM repeat protein